MERFRVFRVFRGSLRPIREIRELRGQFSVPPPLRPSALRLLTSAFQHFSISAFLFPRPISEIREIRGQFSVPQSRSPAFQPFSLSAFQRFSFPAPPPQTPHPKNRRKQPQRHIRRLRHRRDVQAPAHQRVLDTGACVREEQRPGIIGVVAPQTCQSTEKLVVPSVRYWSRFTKGELARLPSRI